MLVIRSSILETVSRSTIIRKEVEESEELLPGLSRTTLLALFGQGGVVSEGQLTTLPFFSTSFFFNHVLCFILLGVQRLRVALAMVKKNPLYNPYGLLVWFSNII